MDFEGELAVIIKDKCKNVPETDAFNHILGYCIADDVSARRWQVCNKRHRIDGNRERKEAISGVVPNHLIISHP